MFQGFVELEDNWSSSVIVQNPSASNVGPDAAPTYRVYEAGSDSPILTGTCSQLDTGAITNATNASPIVVTSPAHGLANGIRLNVTGVVGNTNANAAWAVASATADTFALAGSSGNGAYVSGGVWHISGYYTYSFAAGVAEGFDKGKRYDVLFSGSIGGVSWSEQHSFIVT